MVGGGEGVSGRGVTKGAGRFPLSCGRSVSAAGVCECGEADVSESCVGCGGVSCVGGGECAVGVFGGVGNAV